ncbi:monovalent cation/H+ antiporter complex subunit F [Isoptericola sp. BMS4]|uniref:monovalent cation/H+ antiporter complex subunit F n=1 Tax=Isoptericola sp. BMS4 TaxID=2527875 RepID=UPI00142239EF|nr:MrpF/PhaF family protein [Isoptericola sp. BMS4]
MVVVVVLAAVLVGAAAVLALVRVERGPSMLDRAVALDLLTASLVGAIAIEAAWSRRTETIPILVAMSLVGFVGSVVIARFAAREPEHDHQGRAPEDVAAQAREADVHRGEHSAQDDHHDDRQDEGGGRP